MKSKITKTAALAMQTAKNRAKSKLISKIPKVKVTKTSRPRSTTLNKGINLGQLLNVFNIITTLSTIYATIIKFLGPKYKLILPFVLASLVVFRKSVKLFVVINGLFMLLIWILSLVTSKTLDVNYLTLIQLLSIPVAE